MTPKTPPTSAIVPDSIRNCIRMSFGRAPSALRIPISRVRSVTLTSMMFMITMPPTTSEMSATPPATAPNDLVIVLKNPTRVLFVSSSNESSAPGASCRTRPHQHSYLVCGRAPAPGQQRPPSCRSSASLLSRSSSETPSAARPTQLSWLAPKVLPCFSLIPITV